MRFWGFLARVVATLSVLAVAGVAVLAGIGRFDRWDSLNPFTTETKDRTGPSVLKSLNDISEFHPAFAHYETVVDLEDDTKRLPSWVSGERVIYIGKGNVDAVVDFAELDENDVTVYDDSTSVTVRLPAPTMDDPVLDLQNSRVVLRDAGFVTRFQGSDLERRAQLEAVEQMRSAATGEGTLLHRAEDNTTTMLRGLLGSVGFQNVTVTYDG